MSKFTTYKGGIPTDADIKLIEDAVEGIPKEDSIIPYELIDKALGFSRKDKPRWYTIVGAWKRKIYRNNNIRVKTVQGKGYMVLDPNGRVDEAVRIYFSGLKRVKNASDLVEHTDRARVVKEKLPACDHITRMTGTMRVADATGRKQLQYPDPKVSKDKSKEVK